VNEPRDPGWRKAWTGVGWGFIPFYGLSKSRARRYPDGLTAIRGIFLSLLIGLLLFLLALRFVIPASHRGASGFIPYIVIAAGVGVNLLISWILGRPLVTTNAQALATSWRSRTFIGIGCAESPALIGFAGPLIAEDARVYVLGLLFALYGFWRIAPSHGNLARDQEHISVMGSSLDLTAALMAPGPSDASE